MTVQAGSLLYSGKAKSLYETSDPDLLICEFRDDTTAFDGEKHEKLDQKGQTNHRISTFLMRVLSKAGVPTHFEKTLTDTTCVVKRLAMFPIESVIRNVAAGSICRRLGVEFGRRFDPGLLEFFYKNDELHDPLVNDAHVITFGWATAEQCDVIRQLTRRINVVLQSCFAESGLLLVDAKYEFGVDKHGIITLGDEVSPDSCRIWDLVTKEKLDKDRFRQGMGQVVASYAQIAARLGVALPA